MSECVLGDWPARKIVCEAEAFLVVKTDALPVQLCCFAANGTAVEVLSRLVPKVEDALEVEVVLCCALELHYCGAEALVSYIRL